MKQEETISSLSVDPQFESEKISESQPQPTSQSTEKTEPKVETESEGNSKPQKKARVKRPFGSIRCRSCNRYGITAKCPCSPSARYAVMIQSKRISKQRQREIKRVEFATVEDAERFRKMVAEECLSRPAGIFFPGNPFFTPCCFRRCNAYRDPCVSPCVSIPPRQNLWAEAAQSLDPYAGHMDRHQPFERSPFNMKRPREPTMDLHRMSRPRHEEPISQRYMSTASMLSMHPLLAASQNDSRRGMLSGPCEPDRRPMGLSMPSARRTLPPSSLPPSSQRFRESSGMMRPLSAFAPARMGRPRNPFADVSETSERMRRLMMNVVTSCLDQRDDVMSDIPEPQIPSMHKTY